MPGGAARTVLLVLLLAVPFAGCFAPTGHPSSTPGPGSGMAAATPKVHDLTCKNILLFQFVGYEATDPYLPPGFHPRDPQAFLGTPVAFGQAGVLLINVVCTGPQGPLEASSLDIFVEDPGVPGVPPGGFDFYELERYGAVDQLDGALQAVHWPLMGGNVTVTSNTPSSPAGSEDGTVTDAIGTVYTMNGIMQAPVTLGNNTVRFWHERPAGLTYLEIQASINTVTGPGICTARPGSRLAGFLASGPLGSVGAFCPPGTPVVARFPDLHMTAHVQDLPGVRAG